MKIISSIGLVTFAGILFYLGIVGAVIAVAIHFIMKLW